MNLFQMKGCTNLKLEKSKKKLGDFAKLLIYIIILIT